MSLKTAIARIARGKRERNKSATAIDERPHSAYELVTRRALEDLKARVDSIDAKVNGLLWGMLAIVLSEVYRAVMK